MNPEKCELKFPHLQLVIISSLLCPHLISSSSRLSESRPSDMRYIVYCIQYHILYWIIKKWGSNGEDVNFGIFYKQKNNLKNVFDRYKINGVFTESFEFIQSAACSSCNFQELEFLKHLSYIKSLKHLLTLEYFMMNCQNNLNKNNLYQVNECIK